MSDTKYIRITVGHEPVAYRRYGKRVTVRTWQRLFCISTNGVPTLEESYVENECREWCRDHIAKHNSGEDVIRYLHVTWHDGTKYTWSPARHWTKKEN